MNSPRISTVAAVAFKDKNVLLVKHGEAAHHLTGIYGLPGGRLDENEELLDGAAREFQEETGFIPEKSSMIQLPTVYQAEIPRKSGEILSVTWVVFLVKKISGNLRETDEAIPEWVKIEDVSKLNLLPNTEHAINEGLEVL